MMRRRLSVVLLLWLASFVAPAFAQVLGPAFGTPSIRNYAETEYKAHGQTWSAVQDRRGVMYFSNTSGILQFDGVNWTLISVPNNPAVRSLTMASDGTIYYAANAEFGYLTSDATGQVKAVSLRDKIPESERQFNYVWQAISVNDAVYFLTKEKIFQLKNGKIKIVQGRFATSQALLLNGSLFYIDAEKGLCLIDDDKVVVLPQFVGVANGGRVSLAQTEGHEVIGVRASGDLVKLDFSTLWDEKQKRYRADVGSTYSSWGVIPSELNDFVKTENAAAYRLYRINANTFGLATLKAGIVFFDAHGKFLRSLSKTNGLIDNTVSHIYMDNAKNLWVSTNSGISYIEYSRVQASFGSANGIDGLVIAAQRYQGRMYVGSFQQLLVQEPFQFSKETLLPKFKALKNATGAAWSFIEVEGDLLVATAYGLARVEGNNLAHIPKTPADGFCLRTSKKWPGYVFMGGIGNTAVFKKEWKQWVFVGLLKGVEETIRSILDDADGNLWLNTETHGLLFAKFTGDSPLDVELTPYNTSNGLPSDVNNFTAQFGAGLVVGTQNGMYRFAPNDTHQQSGTRQFQPDPVLASFTRGPFEVVNVLASDGKMGLLVGTEKGILWLRSDGQGRIVNTPSVFYGAPITDVPIYRDPEGLIWISHLGLTVLDPWAQKSFALKYPTLIRSVITRTQRHLFDGTYASMNTDLNTASVFEITPKSSSAMELPFTENGLTFHFSAAFYERSNALQFRFKLDGFDDNWSSWGNLTTKEYTNISPGSYTFRVQSRNIYDVSGSEASFSFTVNAPWYLTIWAWLLWLATASATIFGGVRLYTRKLKQEVTVRTKEVVEQREAAVKARHDIALLSEMGRQITGSLNVEAIQDALYQHVCRLIQANIFGIGIVDWDKRVVQCDFVIENGKRMQPYQRSLDATEQPATECVLHARELNIGDLTLDTRKLDLIMRKGLSDDMQVLQGNETSSMPRSALYVPMRLQEKIIGVICVQSELAHAFQDSDIVILRSLAAYAAVAFDNADAYHKLKLTQAKLVEQEKLAALGSIVAGVAHELNTPLGNSLLTASTLGEMTDKFLDDVQSGSIKRSKLESFGTNAKVSCEMLTRNLSSAAQLITSFKQIAVDQSSDQRRRFKLSEVTREVVLTMNSRIRRDEHVVTVNLPEELELDSFPGPYGQVLSNFVMNAMIHAFDNVKGGHITITGYLRDPQHVVISVSDNGSGISEENLNHIFDPFFTTRMGQGGSGLGLHISYNIITAVLGGSISVQSAKGKGTTFEIVLPLVAPIKN